MSGSDWYPARDGHPLPPYAEADDTVDRVAELAMRLPAKQDDAGSSPVPISNTPDGENSHV